MNILDDIQVRPKNSFRNSMKVLVKRIIYLDQNISERIKSGVKTSYQQEELFAILWFMIKLGHYEGVDIEVFFAGLSPSLIEDFQEVNERVNHPSPGKRLG